MCLLRICLYIKAEEEIKEKIDKRLEKLQIFGVMSGFITSHLCVSPTKPMKNSPKHQRVGKWKSTLTWPTQTMSRGLQDLRL